MKSKMYCIYSRGVFIILLIIYLTLMRMSVFPMLIMLIYNNLVTVAEKKIKPLRKDFKI